MKVFPSEMIEIVGEADTIIVHFPFSILHFQLQCMCIACKQQFISPNSNFRF